MVVHLDESVELGLQIMAILSTDDKLDYNCDKCEYKEKRNCAGDPEKTRSVFYSPEFGFELTACPLLYVPDVVHEFLLDYYSIKNGHSLPEKTSESNPRFLVASSLYDGYINKLTMKKLSKPEPEKNSGLGGLRKKYFK